jgi:hypothetical protein
LTPRLAVCAALALLGLAGTALVEACSSATCRETLTCDVDVSGEGGHDATVDSADEASADAETEGATDAGDAADAADAFDASDAADATDAADAADAADALDAADGSDAPVCSCTPAIPAGFQGPVAFVEEAPPSGKASPAPPCVAPYTVQVVSGFDDPLSSPASCTCACGAVSGVACSAVSLQTFSDNICHNQCGSILAGACTDSQCAEPSQSAIATSTGSGGKCAASVHVVVPTWAAGQDWAITGRACAPTTPLPEAGSPPDGGSTASDGGDGGSTLLDGGVAMPDSGCAGTDLCAPPSPFGSSLCVWQSGTVACPASYPTQHLLYASGTDTRACAMGSCSCPPATGVSCAVTATISTSATCSGATLIVEAKAGACAEYSAMRSPSYVTASATPSGGACVPGGSATATGAVTPTGPTTVCCGN